MGWLTGCRFWDVQSRLYVPYLMVTTFVYVCKSSYRGLGKRNTKPLTPHPKHRVYLPLIPAWRFVSFYVWVVRKTNNQHTTNARVSFNQSPFLHSSTDIDAQSDDGPESYTIVDGAAAAAADDASPRGHWKTSGETSGGCCALFTFASYLLKQNHKQKLQTAANENLFCNIFSYVNVSVFLSHTHCCTCKKSDHIICVCVPLGSLLLLLVQTDPLVWCDVVQFTPFALPHPITLFVSHCAYSEPMNIWWEQSRLACAKYVDSIDQQRRPQLDAKMDRRSI